MIGEQVKKASVATPYQVFKLLEEVRNDINTRLRIYEAVDVYFVICSYEKKDNDE